MESKRERFVIASVALVILITMSGSVWHWHQLKAAKKIILKAENYIAAEMSTEAGTLLTKARRRLKYCFFSPVQTTKAYRLKLADIHCLQAKIRQDGDSREKLFLQALKVWPQHFNAMLGLADLLIISQRYSEGMQIAEAAVRIHSDNPEALLTLGKLYYFLEKYSQSIKTLESIKNPNAESSLFLGRSLQKENRHHLSIEIMLPFEKAGSDFQADLTYALACSLGETQQYSEALVRFRKAYELNPDNNPALIKIAHCHYMLNEYGEALEIYNMAQSISPELMDKFITNAAMCCVALDRMTEAQKWLSRCQATEWVSAFLMGKIYASRGEEVKAIDFLSECINQLPDTGYADFISSIKVKIASLYASQRDFTNALNCLDQHEEDDLDAGILLLWAYCLIGDKQYERALKICTELLQDWEIKPDLVNQVENLIVTASFFFAKKALRNDDYRLAALAVEQIVKYAPQTKYWEHILTRLYFKVAQMECQGKIPSDEKLNLPGQLGVTLPIDLFSIAGEWLEKADKIWGTPLYKFYLAIQFLYRGDLDQAIVYLESIRGEDRYDYVYALALAEIGNLDEAEVIIDRLVDGRSHPLIDKLARMVKTSYYLAPKGKWEEAADLLYAGVNA